MARQQTNKQLLFDWDQVPPTLPTPPADISEARPSTLDNGPHPPSTGKPPPLVRPDRQCTFNGAPHWEWPKPVHDRDTITVDRIRDDIDGPSHRFTIRRGDTVEVFFSNDHTDIGEVVGISHTKDEVRVLFAEGSDGIWFHKGAIYPALEIDHDPPRCKRQPLSQVIESVNAKLGQGLTEADRVPRRGDNLQKDILAFLSAAPGTQFTTGDLRHEFRFPTYDPASPLDNPVHFALRELSDAGLIHVQQPAWGEARFSFLTPQQLPYSFDEFKLFLREFQAGSVSFASYREHFERLVSSQEAIKTDLQARFKAKELALLASRLGSYDANRSTKDANAKSIVRNMLSSFLLEGSVRYSPLSGETYEAAVQRKVLAVTPDEYAQEFAKRQAASQVHAQALENPQDLKDFRTFISDKGVEALTDEQLARYDALQADQTRDRRLKIVPTTVEKFQSEELHAIQFQLKDGFHDKRQCPLWIVQLQDRVERDAFNELHRKAKMLGGWFSSFKKADAGFQFLEKASAEKFCSLLNSNADRTDELEARKDRKELTAAERLHELATTLSDRAEETIENSMHSLQNTVRRAEIQAGIRGRAYADRALSRTLHSIAEALSRGEANYLDGIRHKNLVESLETILHLAKWARVRKLRQQAQASERRTSGRLEDDPIDSATIRYAAFPFPWVYKGHLQDLVAQCRHRNGVKQAAEKLAKHLSHVADEYVTFREPHDIDLLVDFLDRAKLSGVVVDRVTSSLDHYNRLHRAGITTAHELRAALREYLPHRAATRGDDPIQVAERELIGKDLPGFFPTPRAIIERMLELAAILPHHAVLEPSCGKGDILDAIQEQCPGIPLTAIEQNQTLSDVLAAKGHEVQFADFLEHQGAYHRIVMNPPFENGADIEHVRHAYALLIPGGRLVSVMSEGPFFRQDKKATEFREWLDEVAGETEKLPEKAFQGREAFRQTGVRTRLLIINKEEQ